MTAYLVASSVLATLTTLGALSSPVSKSDAIAAVIFSSMAVWGWINVAHAFS